MTGVRETGLAVPGGVLGAVGAGRCSCSIGFALRMW